MIQRSVALCDGRYIGIEYIYDVIDGKQINKPERVKEVRKLGQENKLFCPCGCGNNLILYAGDRNVRAQHFRIKCGTGGIRKCTVLEEGPVYMDSMVVLKCWFSDKLKTDDIETRVPIDMVEETTRKPEFSVLSRGFKLGLRYWKNGADIREDRLDVLQGNLSGIKVVYVADASNSPADGQYPETLMKIQERQGYCLILNVTDREYENAHMHAVFYERDIDGIWREICLAQGKLSDFVISGESGVFYHNRSIKQLLAGEVKAFEEAQETERAKRAETERQRLENLKRIQEAEEERRKDAERKREGEEKLRIEKAEKEKEEMRKKDEEFQQSLEERLSKNETVKDLYGVRWFRCKYCLKAFREGDMSYYGGNDGLSGGACKSCTRSHSVDIVSKKTEKSAYDPAKCPECGGKLVQKNGRYGSFTGCCNFPDCRYTRK